MVEVIYQSIIITGLLATGLFWAVRTIRKDRREKHSNNDIRMCS
jgi:hypothetical protein